MPRAPLVDVACVRKMVGAVLRDHTGKIKGCDITADGSCIATASNDKTLRVWKQLQQRETMQVPTTPAPSLPDAFSTSTSTTASTSTSTSTSTTASTADDAGAAPMAWECAQVLPSEAGALRGCCFSPSGDRLAWAGAYFGDCDIRVFAVAPTAEAAAAPEVGSAGPPGAARGASVTTTLHWKEVAVLSGHQFHVWTVSWSPCGQYLASGSADRTVRLWPMLDYPTPPTPLRPGIAAVAEVWHRYDAKMVELNIVCAPGGGTVRCSWPSSAPLGDTLATIVARIASATASASAGQQQAWSKALKKKRSAHRGSVRSLAADIALAGGAAAAGDVGCSGGLAAVIAPGASFDAVILADGTPAINAWRAGRTLWVASGSVWTAYEIKLNGPRVVAVHAPTKRAGSAADAPVVITADVLHGDPAQSRWRWWPVGGSKATASSTSEGYALAFRPPAKYTGQTIVCECTPVSVAGDTTGAPMTTSFVVADRLTERPWLLRPYDRRKSPQLSSASCTSAPVLTASASTAVCSPAASAPPPMTVVSFNVLADVYVARCMDGVMFGHCAPKHLDPNYRERLLLDELLRYDADVLCLQEVEWWSFEHFLEPALRGFGFHGRHDAKHGQSAEGCATFYRVAAFKEVYRERLSMRNAARAAEYSDLFFPFLDKKFTNVFRRITTCIQFTLLESKLVTAGLPARHVLVINTHLFYHPGAPHVRNVTVAVLLRAAQRILAAYCPYAAVVLCGDFNSYPDTGVVEYLLAGRSVCIDTAFVPRRCLETLMVFCVPNIIYKKRGGGGRSTPPMPHLDFGRLFNIALHFLLPYARNR